MRYFLLRRDTNLSNLPVIKDVFVFKKNFAEELPKISTFQIEGNANVVFPSMIITPQLLVKADAKEILSWYMPHMKYKSIYCVDSKNHNYDYYHLPMIPKVKCLSEGSEIIESQGIVKKAIFRKECINHLSIFQIEELPAQQVVVRMDILESLLARGMNEFQIEETELS